MQTTPISEMNGVSDVLLPILTVIRNVILQLRESLRATFKAGVPLSLKWRKQQLLQLARMVQENAPAFAEAVSKDLGKPKTEMYFGEIVIYSARVAVRLLT